MLQQIDTPQFLYDHPANLFVAGFIGSPSMNMVGATLARTDGKLTASSAATGREIPEEVLGQRPDLKGTRAADRRIRPEDMEDALVSDAPADHRIRSAGDPPEALGADVLAHFMVKAPVVLTEDVKELAHDVGAEAVEAVEREARKPASRSSWPG